MAASNHWTLHGIAHPKKRAMLGALEQVGNVTRAAELAHVPRRTHYQWLEEDEDYQAAVVDAMDRAADRLEEEARRRAVEGVEEPVYQGGQLVGTVRKYSDTLLIFLLKGTRPDKYRERISQENTGTVKVDATHKHQLDASNLTPEELTALGSLVRKLAPPG